MEDVLYLAEDLVLPDRKLITTLDEPLCSLRRVQKVSIVRREEVEALEKTVHHSESDQLLRLLGVDLPALL